MVSFLRCQGTSCPIALFKPLFSMLDVQRADLKLKKHGFNVIEKRMHSLGTAIRLSLPLGTAMTDQNRIFNNTVV